MQQLQIQLILFISIRVNSNHCIFQIVKYSLIFSFTVSLRYFASSFN